MANSSAAVTPEEAKAVLSEIEPERPRSIRDELPPMLDRKQAAAFAGVSVQTITNLCNKGELKACRFGNRIRISRDAMLEFVGLA